jgi:hypothetical protein
MSSSGSTLLDRRRAGWLEQARAQLTDKAATVVRVGTEDDVTWLRGQLRTLARQAGMKIRTGHHCYLTETTEEWTVWAMDQAKHEVTSEDHARVRSVMDKISARLDQP